MKKELKEMIKSNSFPKCYFTKEDMSRMRAINLVDFLLWYDSNLIIKERGSYRLSFDSSVVLNNVWARDFSTDKSYTAIDFCNRYLHLSMYGSMYVLHEYLKQGGKTPASINHLLPADTFNTKLKDGTYTKAEGIKQIYAYLCYTRKISPKIVKDFIDNDYIYAETLPKGHNLLFTIYNKEGKITGFERTGVLSNTDNRYKGCIITEEYSGFSYRYKKGITDTVIACESAIDIMSILTLNEYGKIILPEHTGVLFISLRGLQAKVLEQFASCDTQIILCTDNDIPGIEFSKRIEPYYKDLITTYDELKKYSVKDWNELLSIYKNISTPIHLSNELPF